MYDIAPIMLHILNLSIPYDMDGNVLKQIFEEKSEFAKRPIRYQKEGEKEKEKLKEKISNLKSLGKI